ncbi:hypothetical protein BAnh1_11580 [Bartonella australis AUST/NH1]|uniref:Cell division protein ZapA n=1 Tax=Bartonella australis (strain Aust/NH1) TaxID=1094489 RepID=M1PEH1_BARAA|nr:cell division protein ZapA [Bartonella australis]AGF75026.1 hypothetical protein BAnh1_11580 [Bartonella australis AUST/NH1]
METIPVTIDGKVYRMACDEGQEHYLTELAAQLDQYITHLKKNFGEIGDHRLSVMAGIMIIDEMEEIKREHKKLKESYTTLLRQNDERDRVVSKIVQETTQRIEKLTKQLLKDDQANSTPQEEDKAETSQ